MTKDTPATEVRLDKWLWAARCFKTRSVATDACAAGHVKLNGTSAKAAKPVRIGDRIEVVTPGGERILEVAALSERRGSAAVARELYVDHTPPPPPKEERPAVPTRERGMGRPSKREQRLIRKLRGY
jgi:ribosome-associated heat shock protein Hsp15